MQQDLGHASAYYLGLDLTAIDAIDKVLAWLEEEQIPLKYLINNVGFGRGGLFEDVALREYQLMLSLNNQVMVNMTYALLPRLKASKGGILNVSSMEATLPLPYKTVYTGTKAFIYNLSLALREEFRYYDISVSVLCPGPVLTNEDGLVRIKAQGWKARLLVKMPEEIAPPLLMAFWLGKPLLYQDGYQKP